MLIPVTNTLLLVLPLLTAAEGDTSTPLTRSGAPRYPDHSKLMIWRDASGIEHPVRTPDDWAKRRAHILLGMQDVMGPFPPPSRRVPLDIQTLDSVDMPRFIRKRISYATEPGCRVSAYLFLPKQAASRVPAVLCCHSTAERGKDRVAAVEQGPRSRQYAFELAERGYITIAPDYVTFGEHKWDPYSHGYISASMKGIWDHMRAVDVLLSLKEADPDRIAAIGHSLGGHNAMFVATFDPRIKVIVSSCGFNAFHRYRGGDLKGWSHNGYMPKIPSYGGWQNMPFDFHEVVAALAPRPFFVNAPLKDDNFDVRGVNEAIEAALPVYRLLGAGDGITVVHPDCPHDFPDAVRQQIYDWMDKQLEFRPPADAPKP